MHLLGKPGAESLDYDEITAASVGYIGAEIQYFVNKVVESLRAAMSGKSGKSSQTQDVLAAILTTPGQITSEQVANYDAIAIRLRR